MYCSCLFCSQVLMRRDTTHTHTNTPKTAYFISVFFFTDSSREYFVCFLSIFWFPLISFFRLRPQRCDGMIQKNIKIYLRLSCVQRTRIEHWSHWTATAFGIENEREKCLIWLCDRYLLVRLYAQPNVNVSLVTFTPWICDKTYIYCTFLQSGASCTSLAGKREDDVQRIGVHRNGKYSRVRGTPTHTIINNKNKELISGRSRDWWWWWWWC